VAARDELAGLDGVALAERLAAGDLSRTELLEATFRRIEVLGRELGAVTIPLFDRARELADRPSTGGPLAGVPTLLKATIPWAGAPHTYACRFFASNVARESHVTTERLVAAGLLPVGLSNASEFGLLPTTESALHGPARNPWDLQHSTGGSSGGSAAAVAAGIVPLAQGSDGGGSIRIPAAACGVFGLKPTRGRHPESPSPESMGLSVVSCVSRSVRDSAAHLDVIRGTSPGDRWWTPEPERPYLEAIRSDPAPLRVAFATTDLRGRSVDPESAAAVRATAALLDELGHHVEEAALSLDAERFERAFVLQWAVNGARPIRLVTEALGRPPERDAFEPWTWALASHEARHRPFDLFRATEELQRVAVDLARFLERFDVWLTPCLGEPTWPVGDLDPEAPFEAMLDRLTAYVAFTPLANATGVPAMSVPLHLSPGGRPIGSHFTGRFGEDGRLLALAAQLERARPWA
jgi:amidase